tara:strand:+ start:226 stop:501 length:276 start_codon:yes stop_codon:yes gene_type:complete
MEVNMEIKLTKAEEKMCAAYARIAHPADHRELFDHICDVAKPYGNLHPEVWINKMVVASTKLWEEMNPDIQASKMLEDILHDSSIKHMNFK